MQKRINVRVIDYDISQDSIIVRDVAGTRYSIDAAEFSFQVRECGEPLEFFGRLFQIDHDMLEAA